MSFDRGGPSSGHMSVNVLEGRSLMVVYYNVFLQALPLRLPEAYQIREYLNQF
jgi:hypothetical protein